MSFNYEISFFINIKNKNLIVINITLGKVEHPKCCSQMTHCSHLGNDPIMGFFNL